MTTPIDAPVIAPVIRVHKDWIDYNGHMNVAYYLLVLDKGVDHLFERLGLGPDFVARTQRSTFTMQTSIWYRQEVKQDDPLEMQVRLLGHDAKRMHIWIDMLHAQERYLAAEFEQISLHVDLATRTSIPFADDVKRSISDMAAAHGTLPRPASSGLGVSLERRKS